MEQLNETGGRGRSTGDCFGLGRDCRWVSGKAEVGCRGARAAGEEEEI